VVAYERLNNVAGTLVIGARVPDRLVREGQFGVVATLPVRRTRYSTTSSLHNIPKSDSTIASPSHTALDRTRSPHGPSMPETPLQLGSPTLRLRGPHPDSIKAHSFPVRSNSRHLAFPPGPIAPHPPRLSSIALPFASLPGLTSSPVALPSWQPSPLVSRAEHTSPFRPLASS